MEDKRVYRKPGRSQRPRQGAVLAMFGLFIVGFSLFNVIAPKRVTSELENRRLAQMPAFRWEALLDGSWFDDFATYLQDQVAFRDSWINLESAVNNILFAKVEENDILLGKDGWMFSKLFASEDEHTQLQTNTAAVAEFAARYPGRVTFLLAPSASVIYPEMLPAGAPMMDENALLDTVFSEVSATARVLDLRETFSTNKGEYLYFKTDHHWTPLGAYFAYEQFCAQQGLTPFDRAAHEATTVPNFLGTHYLSTRRWNVQPDEITYYPLSNQMTIYEITGEAQFSPLRTEPLINTEKFDTYDKYAAFLDGNNGYSVIEGDGTGSILVVKDSYANSFVPYLTANYAKIGVVDLRSFAYGLDSTIAQEGYDQILILYNFQTFLSDGRVVYMNRPSTLTATPESAAQS